MKFLKRINLLVLITFFMSLVPVAPVFAMQTAGNATLGAQFEGAATLLKDIYTLKYLDGDRGQHRDATFLEKATNSPDRALATVAIYGLTFLLAKKFYDFAQKRGIFSRIFDDLLNQPEQPVRGHNPQPAVGPAVQPQPVPGEQPVPQVRQAGRVRQPNGPRNNGRGRKHKRADKRADRKANRRQMPNRQQRPAPQPEPEPAPQPAPQPRNVQIADPLPGQQLQLNGLPGNLRGPNNPRGPNNLPGFYHMESATPYQVIPNSCGINAAYNMAFVEAQVAGRQVDNNAFNNALNNVAAHRNHPQHNGRVLRDVLGRRGFTNNEITQLAAHLRLAPMTFLANPGAAVPNAFNPANGAQVAHFLCNVPGHWIAISVVRHADGTQAMYLYDNLNRAARSIPVMRQYVEAIYNRFF